MDVEFGKELGDLGEIEEGGGCMYVSEECVANVAFVNTHAQLEAMRDEALMNNINKANANGKMMDGPRVLVVGPADCGKTSLVKVLTSYGEFSDSTIDLHNMMFAYWYVYIHVPCNKYCKVQV